MTFSSKTLIAALAVVMATFVCADHSDHPIRAAGVTVLGGKAPDPAAIDVKLGVADVLSRSAGLVNKNTLAMDNNVYVTRSNLVFTQNDRLTLARKIESLVMSETDADAATLSRNIMRIVSLPGGKDTVTMAKVSAVVSAARSGDKVGLDRRIMDLVDTALTDDSDESDGSDDSDEDDKKKP